MTFERELQHRTCATCSKSVDTDEWYVYVAYPTKMYTDPKDRLSEIGKTWEQR